MNGLRLIGYSMLQQGYGGILLERKTGNVLSSEFKSTALQVSNAGKFRGNLRCFLIYSLRTSQNAI
jgi:hypothetical protein